MPNLFTNSASYSLGQYLTEWFFENFGHEKKNHPRTRAGRDRNAVDRQSMPAQREKVYPLGAPTDDEGPHHAH